MRLKKEKNTRGFTDEDDRGGGKMSKDIKITWGSSGKDISPQEGSVRVGTSGKPISEGASLITSYSTAGKVFAPCPAYKDGVECNACGLCVVKKEDDVKGIIAAGAGRISALNPPKVQPELAKYIDHTLLKPSATKEDIKKLCDEAKKFGFASVCVNPSWVSFCKKELDGSDVKVCTVIGFPLGATTPTTKALEARESVMNGADEIDMVINVGALKSGDYQLVLDDIKAVREATKGKILKVIIETALLTDAEKVKACQLSKMAGADFVKTSTGFGGGGATAKDVALMKDVVGPSVEVKASGGIRTKEDAEKMIEAGATRIGASASVAIVTGGTGKDGY